MSDLSRLLGDVYDADPATPSDVTTDDGDRTSGLPEWADDEVLDKAFESWVPGPPADAPAAERSLLTDLAGDPVVEVTEEETSLESVEVIPADVSPEQAPAAPTTPPRVEWQRSADDIIVGHRRKGLFRR